jgi:hypothetical protein
MNMQREFVDLSSPGIVHGGVSPNSGSVVTPQLRDAEQNEGFPNYSHSRSEVVTSALAALSLPIDDKIAIRFLERSGVNMVRFAVAAAEMLRRGRQRDPDAQIRLHYVDGYERGERALALIVVTLQSREANDLALQDELQALAEEAVGEPLRELVVASLEYAG